MDYFDVSIELTKNYGITAYYNEDVDILYVTLLWLYQDENGESKNKPLVFVNVTGTTKEGFTAENYVPACIKQPQLFSQSPDTIAEHINVMLFANLNAKKPVDGYELLIKKLVAPIKLTYSSSLLMLKYLIIPKMFENLDIPKELKGNALKEKLQKYLEKNSEINYTLRVKGKGSDISLLQKCLKQLNCESRFVIRTL